MAIVVVLALAAAAPIFAVPAVQMFDRRAGYPLAALFVCAAVILARHASGILGGRPLVESHAWAHDFLAPGVDVDFAVRVDALGLFFALLALVIGAVVFVYSAAYLHNNAGNMSFYTIMSGFTLGVLLLVLADDVVLLFIAWELVSIGSFLLIARAGSGGEAGSIRTLILTFTGGLTLLVALAIMAVEAGSTNLSVILDAPFWSEDPALTTVLAVLVAVSAFTKSAQLPFHFWLPEAMAAATPVSAFLHAAAVVKAGIYLLLRFSSVFAGNHTWNVLLITVGMATAVMASLYAIQKTDLKRLTAYSTVSHLGWIVATIGVGTPLALAAAVVHTLTHALFKSSLFMLIGVIDHQAGSRDVRRLGPIWRKMPFTFVSTAIGALSMAAVPPLMGFLSKEGMLEAFTDAPLGGGPRVVLLVAAAVGALFTFTYSARLVLGAFVDGPREVDHVKEAPVSLWLPAALPGLVSLPLAFFAGLLDHPISAVVGAVTHEPHLHLALWHGVTLPLAISVGVLALGVIGVVVRKRILPPITDAQLAPYTGNELLNMFTGRLTAMGRQLGRMADSYSPTRHLLFPLLVVIAVFIAALVGAGVDGVLLDPRVAGIDRPTDLVAFTIIVIGVLGLVISRSRVSSAIALGVVGVGVSLQILGLGAPDVALTQFLVELLVVVIIMMVVRQQPKYFHRVSTKRMLYSSLVALGAGAAAFAGVYTLTGRHSRPEIALWYLEQAPAISGGNNIVNTILVEFRALDTLGELSVLGMAGVVIAAVAGSIPRHPFQEGTHPVPLPEPGVNSIPLKTFTTVAAPLLWVLAAVIFFRGHNNPGGGFIAALAASSAIMLKYLAEPTDKPVVKENTPFLLTGFGILIALASGYIGMAKSSFLYPIHGHALGQHLTTSVIFDAGVFLAVLGMVTLAINALGGYLRPGADLQLLPFRRGSGHPLNQSGTVKKTTGGDEQPSKSRAKRKRTKQKTATTPAAGAHDENIDPPSAAGPSPDKPINPARDTGKEQ